MAYKDFPAEFWAQPQVIVRDEPLKLMYAELVARLKEEAEAIPGFGVVETMMMERVALLYCHIRQKEALADRPGRTESTNSGFAHDRAYKETMALWFQMAGELRKVRGGLSADPEKVRAEVMGEVAERIRDVLQSMPDIESALQLQTKFAEAFRA